MRCNTAGARQPVASAFRVSIRRIVRGELSLLVSIFFIFFFFFHYLTKFYPND